MNAVFVDVQADRWVTVAACAHGTQERILDANDRCVCEVRYFFAAVGGRAIAPHSDCIFVFGRTDANVVAGKGEDTSDTFLCQKAAIVDVKTPQRGFCGV